MFWDGTAWRDQAPPAAQPKPRRRLVDLLATIPILMLVPLLLSPYLSTEAAGARLSISGTAVPAGQLTVMGEGWSSRLSLQLTWDGSSAGMPRVRTNAIGSFTTSITVPLKALPAQHTLAAVATNNGRVTRSSTVQTSTSQALTSLVLASVTVTVIATSGPGDPPPPANDPTPRPTAAPPVPPTEAPAPNPTPTIAPPPPTADPTPAPDPGPTLTFATECGGSSLDSRWRALFGPGDPGFGRDSDFMANLSQVSVANGRCRITAERTATPSGRPYASACMATYGTFAQKFGIFEARVRYGNGQGVWPAFFLLPAGQKSPYPEVDIFEAYPGDPAIGGPGVVVYNVHYAGEPADQYQRQEMWQGAYLPGVPDLTLDYHVHRLVWTSNKVEFWLDGVLKFTVREHVPQVAMYPILNLAMGAPSYRIDGSTPDVVHMDIDYVRVWSL